MSDFIPVANPQFSEDDARAVYDVVSSGWVSMGKKVQEFEQLVCDYTDSKYAVAMNNGTSTLHTILLALEIGPGDEVILPSLTYISSANVVLYVGATPVLCDNNLDSFNVEPEHIQQKITKRTKAFMTVDLKGMPVDYDAFNNLSRQTGITFISDSAESLGAEYKNNKVGSQAFASSFSFFANKNITTGEGGMVMTNEKSFYEKLKILRNQGQEGRYNHTRIGYNYRMTDILAALGIIQMNRIDSILDEKDQLAVNYKKSFQETNWLKTPFVPEYVTRHSWYNYTISLDSPFRDDLIDYLDKNKIETRLSFPPVHIQPVYKELFNYNEDDIPNAYKSYLEFIDIPIWKGMGTENQNRIIESIIDYRGVI